MIGRNYDPTIFPDDLSIRHRMDNVPTKEELAGRDSFPSVNDNKYLDAILKSMKKERMV
ncbi:DUF2737 family protein [Klebsiella pneumoniae]|uniref:DUF2737 family protein n=1 Tax=Klebsiella pneumoniae TaxID=573 RepID=UPI00236371CE|nr:DUF2737 family protein [Klebsiella pneumoniae]MDD1909121.1 DUF2737 family protein [Klebsiella pneumoniae]MDD1914414.1 DUF2737 family protein [Klebsiella pneumoniae]